MVGCVDVEGSEGGRGGGKWSKNGHKVTRGYPLR